MTRCKRRAAISARSSKRCAAIRARSSKRRAAISARSSKRPAAISARSKRRRRQRSIGGTNGGTKELIAAAFVPYLGLSLVAAKHHGLFDRDNFFTPKTLKQQADTLVSKIELDLCEIRRQSIAHREGVEQYVKELATELAMTDRVYKNVSEFTDDFYRLLKRLKNLKERVVKVKDNMPYSFSYIDEAAAAAKDAAAKEAAVEEAAAEGVAAKGVEALKVEAAKARTKAEAMQKKAKAAKEEQRQQQRQRQDYRDVFKRLTRAIVRTRASRIWNPRVIIVDNEGTRMELRADQADRSKIYDKFVKYTQRIGLPTGFHAGYQSPVEQKLTLRQERKSDVTQRRINGLCLKKIPNQIKKATDRCDKNPTFWCLNVIDKAKRKLLEAEKEIRNARGHNFHDVWAKRAKYTEIKQTLDAIVNDLAAPPPDEKERRAR